MTVDIRFEVSMAATMKNVVFWDVTGCASCKKRRFGGRYRLHQQQLLVTVNVVPSSLIPFQLMLQFCTVSIVRHSKN
jgi:hypothetical protein